MRPLSGARVYWEALQGLEMPLEYTGRPWDTSRLHWEALTES